MRRITSTCIALFFVILAADVSAQFTGRTVEERQQAYINDQGNYFRPWFPAAMSHAVFAWLERPDQGNNRALISEEIGYITNFTGRNGEPACTGRFFWPWKNCWWTGDHQSVIIVSRIYYQYYQDKKVLTDADALKCKDKLREAAFTTGVWCGVANYQMRYLVTAYLYAERVEDIGSVEFPLPSDDRWACPQPFSWEGRSYSGGRRYPAKQIYADYLHHMFDKWLREGTAEDYSPGGYYYAQIHSMALLHDFTRDPVLKRKARMFLDWLLFSYSMSFSANHPGAGHGRTYTRLELSGQVFTPWSVFYNLDRPTIDMITAQGTNVDLYVTRYRHPQVLTAMFESINSPQRTARDNFYRIIRGYVPGHGKPWWLHSSLATSYRYEYVTPHYNLGGTGTGTGWELNIKAANTPFKLFINNCSEGFAPGCNTEGDPGIPNRDGGHELFYLGVLGYQHRNAMFIDGGGKLHEEIGSGAWDEASTESNWRFYRKGMVAVAVKIEAKSALEVCTIGVDYPSYAAFKQAIIGNARLTGSSFTTSKGVEIRAGYVDYAAERRSLPFNRFEVWEGHVGANDERKVVDWRNNVMTISKDGQQLRYNFNNWTFEGSGGNEELPPLDSLAPQPPAGVHIKRVESN